jgi:D-alanyl-D-alanine carboxypeptidase
MRRALLSLLACAACARAPARRPGTDSIAARLERIVARDARLPGVVFAISAPELSFSGAAGRLSRRSGARAATADDLFRTASITKIFVAVAALRAQEAGQLHLDTPVDSLLSPQSVRALTGGGYDPGRITLRMLLQHTAGIFDYTEAPSFYDTLAVDPTHRWTRAEQLALAMNEGSPLHAPARDYRYGDTHYILAAEAVERATGQGLAAVLRGAAGDLDLADTHLESLEPGPGDAAERLIHPYIGGIDTREWDPSWDLYGGGGLVSSAPELVVFFDALFRGELLGGAAMEELTTVPAVGEGAFFGIDGGMGINRFFLSDGSACWAGYGFFTSEVVHCPSLGATWAGSLNQSSPRNPNAITNLALGAL